MKIAPQLQRYTEPELVELIRRGLARVRGDAIVPTLVGGAPPLNNSFEGGSNGTTLTAGSGGNTGGTSGDYFDTVTIGASCTETFQTSSAYMDSLGMQIVQPASAAITLVEWGAQLGTVTTQMWGRVYFRLSAGTFNTIFTLARVLNAAVIAGDFQITNAAHLRVRGNLANITGTATLLVNVWYRLEWTVLIASGAANVVEGKIFIGESGNALETVTHSDTTQTQATKVQYGTISTPIASSTLDLDGLNANIVGYPGPAIVNFPPKSANVAMTGRAGG